MAQHDYNLANQTGADFRADLNNALSAIATVNSGASEPSTTFAHQLWVDTSNNLLKIRNAANSAFITTGISITANNVFTGALTGNASTATTLATARTINGTSFDGSANISFNTDSVAEGSSNLYFTNERVDDQVNTLLQAGTGIQLTYDDTAGTLTIANTNDADITGVVAGNGLTGGGTSGDVTLNVAVDDSSIEIDSDALRVKALGITNAMLAGSIANSKLANSSVSINSQSLSLGGTLVLDTDNIGEGSSNLYYTDARVNSAFDTRLATKDTGDLSEGSNLYYTQARFDSAFGNKTTANLTENTNLYYTDTRANSAIDARVTKAFVDALGIQATSVAANSVALGTDTTGNYVQTITGTANKITASGSGSESANITLSLPDDVQIADSLTVAGNLTVNGTLVSLDTTNLDIADNLFQLNAGLTGSPVNDSGMLINRGNQDNGIFMWDESVDKFTMGLTTADGTSTGNITLNSLGTLVANVEGNVTGTIQTAAQPNITSLGTLTTLTVDDITINGSVISDSGTLTIDAGSDLKLDADSSNIYLADGGTDIGLLSTNNQDLNIRNLITDKDIYFQGNDGGSTITALTLDMSDAGAATFNGHGTFNDTVAINSTSSNALLVAGSGGGINFTGGNNRVYFNSNRALEGAADGSTLTVGEGYTTINIDGTATMDGLTVDGSGIITNTASTTTLTLAGNTGSVAGLRLQAEEVHADIFGVNEGNNYGGLKIQTNSNGTLKDRLKIESNGDISFYEDTGSTAKLFWDASAESLGIATTATDGMLTIKKTGSNIFGDSAITINSADTNQSTLALGLTGSVAYIDSTESGSGTVLPLVFATASAERMRIDASGKVGIGGSPSENLSIVGSANTGMNIQAGTSHVAFIDFGDSGDTNFGGINYNNTDDTLNLRAGNANRLTINSSGNVGIGTSSPTSELTVIGNVRAGSNVAPTSTIQNATVLKSMQIFSTSGQSANRGSAIELGGFFDNSASTTTVFGAVAGLKEADATGVESGYLSFQTNSTGTISEKVRITSSGNLLVGNTVTNPASGFNNQKGFGYTASSGKVEIATTADSAALEIGKNQANDGDLLVFRKQSNTVGSIGANGTYPYIGSHGTSGKGLKITDALLPATNSGGFNDADVNLGASNVRWKDLYLSGTARTNQLRLENSGSTTSGLFHEKDVTGSGTSTNLSVFAESGKEINFMTNGSVTKAMTIDSSGNVGIGASPSSTIRNDISSAEKALQIGNRAMFFSDGGVTTDLQNNSHLNNSNNRVAMQTDAGSLYQQYQGVHKWFNAASVSAGATQTMTERMRIDASGNVGIGISPSNTFSVGASGTVTTRYTSTDTSAFSLLQFENSGSIVLSADHGNSAANSNIIFKSDGATERMRIDSSGKLFLNATSVTAGYTGAHLIVGGQTSPLIKLQSTHGAGSAWDIYTSSGTSLIFARNQSDKVAISSAGKVGISNMSPNAQLHIGDANAEGDATNPAIQIGGTTTYRMGLYTSAEGAVIENKNGDDGIQFRVKTAGEAMRIDGGTGNVSIGSANNGLGGSIDLSVGSTSSSGGITLWSPTNGTHSLGFGDGYTGTDRYRGYVEYAHDGDSMRFATGSTERMRIDSSGHMFVGSTSYTGNTTGSGAGFYNAGDGMICFASGQSTPAIFNRTSADGKVIEIRRDGSTVGSIGTIFNDLYIGTGDTNIRFNDGNDEITPRGTNGAARDNAINLGASSVRFKDIYASNGTIQTSDRNEKQDIEALTDAETRVAVAAKGLLRKFKWKSAVEEKGDEARTHFGIIAQDLQDAFTAEGLDAGDYAMFISSTWTDDDGVEQTRLGVRYSELLAFIIAAI
nr:hypothetical protein [uncultured Mediterranean phage uvMED]